MPFYIKFEGQHLPIYNMFDADGEATERIELAVTVVARRPDDRWQVARVCDGLIEPDMSH